MVIIAKFVKKLLPFVKSECYFIYKDSLNSVCEIRHTDNGVSEDSRLVGCCAVCNGKELCTFARTVIPLSQGSNLLGRRMLGSKYKDTAILPNGSKNVSSTGRNFAGDLNL